MEEQQKKAFDFAADVTKQLITLSTAIITITITFSKEMINFTDAPVKWCLLMAWVLYILTVFFGIWTLMALTGNLQPIKKTPTTTSDKAECTINSKNIRVPSMLQIFCFIVALGFTIAFGYKSISIGDKSKNTKIVTQESCKELQIIKRIDYSMEPVTTIDTLKIK